MKTTLELRLHLVFMLMIGLTFGLQAQKNLKKADKQFELKAYELAIENYQLELNENPDCTHCSYRIAESNRLMNQNLDAAIWFRKLEGKSDLPKDFYMHYGMVMKKMGQYNKANELFAEYSLHDPITANYLTLSCEYAKDLLSAQPKYDIGLYQASSNASDYAPAVFKDKVMFSSFRNDFIRTNNKVNTSIVNTQGAQLFVAPAGEDARKNNITHLRTDLEEDYQVVSICYSNDFTRCALTKSQIQHPSLAFNEEDQDLGIYLASVDENGNFFNMIPFPHNEVGYATAFATLNNAGNIMYFASNRPGGMGGYDIYASYYKDGMWTYPDNLGASINTPGNELTPYFDGETIFFASDYHFGLGGYDLFSSYVDKGEWMIPDNLGNGVNSPEDDIFCIKHPLTNEYYVSSNRLGGKGMHDIYIVTEKQKEEELLATNTPVDNAKVDLVADTQETEKAAVITVTEVSSPVKQIISDKKEVVEEEIDLSMYSDDNPPAAVVLSDLNKPSEEPVDVVSSEVKPVVNYGSSDVSFNSAKLVSYGELFNTGKPVYFIQLAAFFTTEADVKSYVNLADFGSLYKIKEASATKVKLGYYYDEYEAKRVLQQVRNMGFTDAFISLTAMDTRNMELVVPEGRNFTYEAPLNNSAVTYKVRLASYSDPSWFDLGSVEDLGTIEQWSKGEWTIFVLSGYSNWENAETARIKAANRGYVDSQVVIDNNGILETINKN